MELNGRPVHFEIGTIAIEGLGRFDGRAIAAAVESELVRIVGANGMPDVLPAQVHDVRGPALDASALAYGGALGVGVGRAIYGVLAR